MHNLNVATWKCLKTYFCARIAINNVKIINVIFWLSTTMSWYQRKSQMKACIEVVTDENIQDIKKPRHVSEKETQGNRSR